MMFTLILFYITFILNPISSTNEVDSSNVILAQNSFVTCYSDHLVIHFYYFSFGGKTIKYDDIRSCELLRNKDLNLFQTKCWGMAFSPIWWPLDIRRHWRDYYIIIDANQWPKIGLTMNDDEIVKVYQLIKQKMSLTTSAKET